MRFREFEKLENPLVLALTPNAVALGFEIAKSLSAPLRLASDRQSAVTAKDITGRSVIVVDDGALGTQAVLGRVRALESQGARDIEMVHLRGPSPQGHELNAQDVEALLEGARHFAVPLRKPHIPEIKTQAVQIADGNVLFDGDLCVPPQAPGLVVFAHGRGSSRKSPRNIHVAKTLQAAGLATLLFDFDTALEAQARRLVVATRWVQAREPNLPIGYFGASTGSHAAVLAAGELGDAIYGIVSRGAPLESAKDALRAVAAPVLLIVGSEDRTTLEINRRALEGLRSEKQLEVIPGATHLFEEPGALEAVAHLAADWFLGCFRHSSAVALRRVGS